VTPTCMVLDASASMAFPDGAASKWALARQLAVALTSVAHASGDPAGVVVAGNPRAVIRPRTRQGIVAEVIQMLHDVTPAGDSQLAPSVVSAARSCLRVALVSDFLGDLDDTLRVVRELIASGHDVYALHIVASEEIDPPAGVSVVMDPEQEDVRHLAAYFRKPS